MSQKKETSAATHPPKKDRSPILVPTDFSDQSVEALAYAHELALLMDRPLTVLHIVHDPASAPGYYRRDTKNDNRTMDAIAADMMADFLDRTQKKVPSLDIETLDTQLLEGIPAARIVEYANLIDAAMIVMGSHGHRGMKALVIASKAKKVVKAAPMPVTIVKAKEVQESLKKQAPDS